MAKKIKLERDKPTVKDLDDLFRQFIRLRDKMKCRRCGRKKNLQVAHVYSRAKKNVRWDEDNAFLLCPICHMNFAHKNPLEFAKWVENKLGTEVYNQLIMKANAIYKTDRNLIKLYLLQRIKEVLSET